jgi:hypothetical protein
MSAMFVCVLNLGCEFFCFGGGNFYSIEKEASFNGGRERRRRRRRKRRRIVWMELYQNL